MYQSSRPSAAPLVRAAVLEPLTSQASWRQIDQSHLDQSHLAQPQLDQPRSAAAPKAISAQRAELLGDWEEYMRLMVKPKRYEHVLRVAALARDIAHASGLDAERAYAAGMLHDIARDLPDAELLRLAPPETDADRQHPLVLHGRAARALLERWGYTDSAVLEAIEDHTTGPRSESGVAACVYVADVSEPGRGVNADIRELAFHDLNAALAQAIGSKVRYLRGRGIAVHPRTAQSYEALIARGVLPQERP